jgi:signal transduction histidine kinase
MVTSERDRLAEFASTLSHDLRTPLSVAIGYTEIARDRCTDEEAIESLTTASDALVRMERLIEDTLTLARDGQTVGETEPVALANVATEAWDGLDTGDATLTLADDLPHIDADPERLRRLLENLFRNSVEHGHPDSQSATGRGSTRGAASGQSEQSEGGGDDAALGRGARGTDGGSGGITVTVTATDDGFRVADDGTGISPEYHGTIFDWGHSANVDGTGLGLSIVDRIAEAHDWSARVTTTESGGAAFEFTGVTHA